MNGEWLEVSLGEVTDFLTGFPFKSLEYTEESTDIALVRGDNVVQGKFRWDGVKRFPKYRYPEFLEYALHDGDVVLAMDRPWIEAGLKFAQVKSFDLPALLVQRVTRLRGTSKLDTQFLRYVIGSHQFTGYVLGVQTGTAVPHISGEQIKNYNFLLPPLEIQQKIASILGALDDKIELNRRTNTTLETIAQTLFKSWFVDFDPVKAKAAGFEPEGLDATTAALFPSGFESSSLGEIPEGWTVESLSMQLEILSGGTPKTTEPTYWDGEILWVAVPDTASGIFITRTAKTITALGLEKSATQLLPAETIVITARGTVGKCAIISKPMTMNQSCYGLRGKKGVGQIFLYFQTLNQVRRLQGGANGSVFDTITRSSFDVLEVIRPSSELLKAFEEFAKPIFQSILQNQLEIESLTITRDSLLPKLLSGELDVSDFNLLEGNSQLV